MAADKKKPTGKPRRRERKSIPRGQAHIQATFNNTIITLTDPNGNVIAWGSAGGQGFKGSRKSTPYAAQVAAEAAARKAHMNSRVLSAFPGHRTRSSQRLDAPGFRVAVAIIPHSANSRGARRLPAPGRLSKLWLSAGPKKLGDLLVVRLDLLKQR